jgi:hypothetical protein
MEHASAKLEAVRASDAFYSLAQLTAVLVTLLSHLYPSSVLPPPALLRPRCGMADPITAITTVITLATFIKDLIELSKSIEASIKKVFLFYFKLSYLPRVFIIIQVGENQWRLNELTKDVLRTLNNLANLTRGQENEFQTPALLAALGNLKA